MTPLKRIAYDGRFQQWTLGSPGKGTILQDGSVHTWNTEHMRPIHDAEMANRARQVYQNDANARLAPERENTRFHIEPTGRVWQYNDPFGTRMRRNEGLPPERHFTPEDEAVIKQTPSLWLGDPADNQPVQADQYGHAIGLRSTTARLKRVSDGAFVPMLNIKSPTHSCPGCGLGVLQNAQGNYTPVYDDHYGQMDRVCPGCGLDWVASGANLPRPVHQEYRRSNLKRVADYDPMNDPTAWWNQDDPNGNNGRTDWEGDPYYYHMAPTSERARIQQHGLQPASPQWSPRWGEYYDGEDDDMGVADEPSEMLEDQPTGVYVTNEPNRSWADGGSSYAQHKWDTWRIPKSQVGNNWMDDPLVPDARVLTQPVRAELHEGGPEEYGWNDYLQRKKEQEEDPRHVQDLFGDYRNYQQNKNQWGIGQATAAIKLADNYTNDSREWPDPTQPRASEPPMPKGCTCPMGFKLDCPIHGMHGDDSDDSKWSLPEASPVGYPQNQDGPRTWTQAVSKLLRLN